MRVHKWLSQLGILSRRQAEKYLIDGRISLNGKILTELGAMVDPETDIVSVDGKKLAQHDAPPRVYWMFHKPDFCLTSTKSEGNKACIFDLPVFKSLSFKVSPVGRLDYRTEGFLLLSNDGELVHRLMHPSFKIERSYEVLISRVLSNAEIANLKSGIELEDGPIKASKIKLITKDHNGVWYSISVHEGRNRIIRRIFESFDIKVVRLLRSAYGDLFLDPHLKSGQYRSLSSDEVLYLKKAVGLVGGKPS